MLFLIYSFTTAVKSWKMVSFLNFQSLLKMYYLMCKLSGFLFISISFDNLKLTQKSDRKNKVIFLVSLSLSVSANFFPAYFPVTEIVNSEILEIGINLITKALIFLICIVKTISFVQKEEFIFIITSVQSLHEKVRCIWIRLSLGRKKGVKVLQNYKRSLRYHHENITNLY